MKKADMMAMPFYEIKSMVNGIPTEYVNHKGITKREMFAMHFAQAYLNGNLSWTNGTEGGHTASYQEVAQESVRYADALLTELDKRRSN